MLLERSFQATCGDLRALGSRGRCLGTDKMISVMQLPHWGKMAREKGSLWWPGAQSCGGWAGMQANGLHSELRDKIWNGAIFIQVWETLHAVPQATRTPCDALGS